MDEPKTPELERMREAAETYHTEAIGEFLESCGYELAEWVDCGDYHDHPCSEEAHLIPVNKPINKILAEYTGIDLNKVEEERRALLAWFQKGE